MALTQSSPWLGPETIYPYAMWPVEPAIPQWVPPGPPGASVGYSGGYNIPPGQNLTSRCIPSQGAPGVDNTQGSNWMWGTPADR